MLVVKNTRKTIKSGLDKKYSFFINKLKTLYKEVIIIYSNFYLKMSAKCILIKY